LPEQDLQQWHSASSRLGETISPGRDHHSPKTKVTRLNEDTSREHSWFPQALTWANHSRLSEMMHRSK